MNPHPLLHTRHHLTSPVHSLPLAPQFPIILKTLHTDLLLLQTRARTRSNAPPLLDLKRHFSLHVYCYLVVVRRGVVPGYVEGGEGAMAVAPDSTFLSLLLERCFVVGVGFGVVSERVCTFELAVVEPSRCFAHMKQQFSWSVGAARYLGDVLCH